MSNYSDFIAKPSSQKIIIFEVDTARNNNNNWFIHEAGIWKYTFTNVVFNTTADFENGSFCYGFFEGTESGDIGDNQVIKQISSFVVDSTAYTQVTSLANLRTTDESFFYSGDTTLYVHFGSFASPKSFSLITIGFTDGYSNQDVYDSNDQFIQSRLKSAPNISISKDKSYYGLQSWAGGDITLANEDGFFDNYIDQTLFGQPCRIKLGGTDLATTDYKTIWTGSIKGVKATDEDFTFVLMDKREQIGRTLPVNFFDSTTYPNISDDNNGKPIPIAYGQCRNCPVVCTNEDEAPAPANYSFTIVDVADHANGIKSIDEVRVNGTAKATASASLPNATFTLAAANYTPGDEVTVDFKSYVDGSGVLIDNALDVLRDIIEVYLDTTYTTDTFDDTQWTAQTALASMVGNIWIKDLTNVEEIVERIDVSNFGSLLLNGEGKWTFKKTDLTKSHVYVLRKDEQFQPPNRSDDGTEYLTSAIVKYNEDNNETAEAKKWRMYADTSQETAIKNEYGTYKTREYKTYLMTAADAQTLAENIMSLYSSIIPTFETTAPLAASEIELLDNIILEVNRNKSEWLGFNKCEVVGISYNLNDFLMTIQCRFISTWMENSDAVVAMYTDDTETFPADLGAGSADTWNVNWTIDQKLYAFNEWGYYSDDNGYINGADSLTLDKSVYGEDA